MYKVYCLTFPDGKKYIGMSRQDLRRRWRHGDGYKGQPVNEAIIKYGWEKVKHEVLYDGLTKEEAEEKEKELIKLYQTQTNGYNVEEGGDSSPMAEESKEKLREKRKEYFKTHTHWNTGRHWSEEVKAKISKSHTGYKYTDPEYLKRKSEAMSGKNNPMYGVKMTKEHKEKLQKACVEATSKACRCIETGEIYKSIAEAQRQTGIKKESIGKVCNRTGYYKTAGGFHWEFVNKEVV